MIQLATVETPRSKTIPIDDAAFIDALDFHFRDAATIARQMLAAGNPATLATIRDRMAEFILNTDAVEAKGAAWRLVASEGDSVAPSTPAPVKLAVEPLALAVAPIANDHQPGLLVNTIYHGDGLDLMRAIPDGSIDLILCDPPYGTCGAKSAGGHNIDVPLDLARLWAEYRRIITPTGNIVVFASQPFNFTMYNAAPDLYKYSNIWRKDHATGHCHARNRPMKDFEEIMIFSPGEIGHAIQTNQRATFNPWKAVAVTKKNNPRRNRWAKYAPNIKAYPGYHDYAGLENCPRMVMEYSKVRKGRHPFQKPVLLLDDLIRMYSNPGEVVLDNCAGSGSTAIAAIGAGRDWIAIEKAEDVFETAKTWIAQTLAET